MSTDDRREQLLKLGLKAFTRSGYDQVSTDAIAEQAGISRGLLFHYFPTKHDFYVASLKRAADKLVEETVRANSIESRGAEGRATDPLSRLWAGLEAYLRYIDKNGPAYSSLLRGGVGSDKEVQELVESTRLQIIAGIRSELPPTPTGTEAALRTAMRGWIGLVEGMALDWLDHRDLPTDELIAIAVRALVAIVPEASQVALGATAAPRHESAPLA